MMCFDLLLLILHYICLFVSARTTAGKFNEENKRCFSDLFYGDFSMVNKSECRRTALLPKFFQKKKQRKKIFGERFWDVNNRFNRYYSLHLSVYLPSSAYQFSRQIFKLINSIFDNDLIKYLWLH